MEASLAACTACTAATAAAQLPIPAMTTAPPPSFAAATTTTAAATTAGTTGSDAAASAAAAQAAQALAGIKLPVLPEVPVAKSVRKAKAGNASARGGMRGSARTARSMSTRSDSTRTQNTRTNTPAQAPYSPPRGTAASGGVDAATAAAAKAAQAMANVSVADCARAPKVGAPSAAAQGASAHSAQAAAAAAAAQAVSAMGTLSGRVPPAGAGTQIIALERKLAKCVYACVADFDRVAVCDAFDTAQRTADLANGHVQQAKSELHLTLWHKSSASRDRGRACIAADGQKITFEISGFDVSDRISAARVRKLEPQQEAAQQASSEVMKLALDVAAPHITLCFASGTQLYCSWSSSQCSKVGFGLNCLLLVLLFQAW